MSDTSTSLIRQLQRPGQNQAWRRFIDLYMPLLYCWTRKMRVPVADADDLVQEVFVVPVRKLPEFEYDPALSFRGWLRTVTLNKWREILRRRELFAPNGPGGPLENLAAPEDDPSFWDVEHRQLVARRYLELIRDEFQPPTWKACWECVVEGRAAPEVAAELNLTPGAVRAAKFRVLTRLRAELRDLLD